MISENTINFELILSIVCIISTICFLVLFSVIDIASSKRNIYYLLALLIVSASIVTYKVHIFNSISNDNSKIVVSIKDILNGKQTKEYTQLDNYNINPTYEACIEYKIKDIRELKLDDIYYDTIEFNCSEEEYNKNKLIYTLGFPIDLKSAYKSKLNKNTFNVNIECNIRDLGSGVYQIDKLKFRSDEKLPNNKRMYIKLIGNTNSRSDDIVQENIILEKKEV